MGSAGERVGFIGGPPKVGKSCLALDLAISLASGTPFLGREVRKTGVVYYFTGEEFLGDVAGRADRLLSGRGLTREALGDRLMLSDFPVALEAKVSQDLLVDGVKEGGPVLVVLDPLARFLTEADENSASEMRIVTNFIRQRLNRRGEVAVCVVHHTDKKGSGLRGTGDLRALSEVTLLTSGSSPNRVKLEVEMRGARAPEPLVIELRALEDGGVAWHDSAATKSGALGVAKQALQTAGAEGMTVDKARAILGVRWPEAKALLELAGGRQLQPKGRWYLPEYLPRET
jgi:hypothetical protein